MGLGPALSDAFSVRKNFGMLVRPHPSNHQPLDGLRGFAMLWVLGAHALYFRTFQSGSKSDYAAMLHDGNLVIRFLLRGDLAVDVFFVLSGYLIGTLLMREHQKTGRIALGNFFARRALRLLPVYWLILFLVCSPHRSPWRATAWANVLYVNDLLPAVRQAMPWTWSLAIEEQFYLTFPLVLLALLRARRYRVHVLVGLVALSSIFTLVLSVRHGLTLPLHMVPVSGHRAELEYLDAVYDKPYTRFGALLCGVIVAYVRAYGSVATIDARVERTAWWGVPLAFAVMAVVLFLPVTDPDAVWPATPALLYMSVFRNVFSVATAYLIMVTFTGGVAGRLLSKALSWRVWYVCAQLSYVTYLIHPVIMWAVYKKLPARPYDVVTLLGYCALFAFVSFAIAAVFHLAVERPFMRLRPRNALPAGASSGPAAVVAQPPAPAAAAVD